MLRTLYAGDGYLSQSSKWLHFGLGRGQRVKAVHVRWPNGRKQQFDQIQVGGRYVLTEGTQQARVIPPRKERLVLAPGDRTTPRDEPATRSFLANPIPMPVLTFASEAGAAIQPIELAGRPTLITFWASWCGSCLQELGELTAHEPQLRGVNLEVLALQVDSLAQDHSSDPASPGVVLDKLKFPFRRGVATRETLSKLQIVERIALNQLPPFAVPLNLLVDSQGRVAAIYRGPLSMPTLLADVAHLDASTAERRDFAIPFAGRWMSPPATLLLRPVAQVFQEAGYEQDYQRYLELDRQQLVLRRQAAVNPEQRREVDQQYATVTFNLGRTRQLEGQIDDAIDYYRQGLEVVPDSAMARWYLAKAFAEKNEVAQAIEQLQQAQQLDPTLVDVSVDLARLLKSQGDLPASQRELEAALQVDPRHAAARFELALTLAAAGQTAWAIGEFRQLSEQRPADADVWANLGTLCAKSRQYEEAIEALQRAVQLAPDHAEALQSLAGALAATGEMASAADCFRRVAQLRPQQAAAHAGLGQALSKLGKSDEAATAFERAIRLNPRDGGSMLRLAWISATSPDDAVRNGDRAVELAERLARATAGRDAHVLDTLAAAYAEQGRFDLAERTIGQALQQLSPEDVSTRAALEARRRQYQARQPYRETR